MNFTSIVSVMLLASTLALPVAAQTVDSLDKRLDRVEKEVRAVQRKVFPGGDERFFEPEVTTPDAGNAGGFGVTPATPGGLVTDRIDAVEAQLATLTGQIEENNFKLKQLEEQLTRFESDAKYRLSELEGNGVSGGGIAATDGSGGGAYDSALALYESGDYPAAELAFASFVEENGDDARASEAGYWQGRALLQQDKPVQAVQAFLSNYQDRREGARAPDSLLWVGRALMAIDPPRTEQACQAYDRLETEYSGKLSDEVAAGVVESRLAASCG